MEAKSNEPSKGENTNGSPHDSPMKSGQQNDSPHSQRASTSRSPDYVPSFNEDDRRERTQRSMSIDSDRSRRRSRSNSVSNGYRSRSQSRSRSRSPSYVSTSKNSIEILGLTKNVYANHLEQIFGIYGTIQDILVPTDRYTHENIGRAYITFQSSSNAIKAREHMDGGQIDGAIIDVQLEGTTRTDENDRQYHRRVGSNSR